MLYVRGSFEKFVDSPFYSELELCGGTVTISSKYLPWQAMSFLQRSTHFSKTCCNRWSLRNFLPQSSLFMIGNAQKSHGARSGLFGRCSNGVSPSHFSQAEHRIQFRSRPVRFLGSFNREKGATRQEISNCSTVWNTFSRSVWNVVRSASLAKGGT
jgi:hypothetical protein